MSITPDTPILIMTENPLTKRLLNEAVTQAGFGITDQPDLAAYALLNGTNTSKLTCPFIDINAHTPLRLGHLMDQVRNHLKTIKNGQNTTPLHIGDMILTPADATLTKKGGKAINLTEKEVMILSFLFQHHPAPVSRQALLDGVWGYAQDVETHTLETHIYRLRQKIEHDPAHPQILTTTENGYCLDFWFQQGNRIFQGFDKCIGFFNVHLFNAAPA